MKRQPLESRYSIDSFGELHTHPRVGTSIRVGHVEVAWEMLTWMGNHRPIVYDLLNIATAVHHVDRIAPRLPPRPERGGHEIPRRIEVAIAVIEPGQWNSVRSALERLLRWMTDDSWELTFTHSVQRPPRQTDLNPERLAEPSEVALFSGGLDSLAGAVARLKEHDRSLYLLSSLGTSVRKLFLQEALGPIDPLRSRWIGFRHHLGSSSSIRLDTLNRTRGFLYLSAAAAAADTLGVSSVATYECGVGALNLPMNGAQWGAQNTHAMHPRTLLELERIFARVLEKNLRLETPFFLHTKGELCRKVGEDLMRLAEVSNSCDETERNKSDRSEHCGVCTSCLLRRTALHSVLGASDPTYYRLHATRRNGLYQINAFGDQAQRFAQMVSYDDLVSYASSVDFAVDYLVERRNSRLPPGEARRALVDLIKRHATEVRSFYEQETPWQLLNRARQPRSKMPHHDLFSSTR